MRMLSRAGCTSAVALALGIAHAARGHGYAGDRFFPPTIATDDPFAVDELALPTLTYFDTPAGDGSPSGHQFNGSFEFDKEIFPHFALGVSDGYVAQHNRDGTSAYGLDNLELTAKYEFLINDPHELILAVGMEAEAGGTGARKVADSFSTISPAVYFGKGFGDLPKALSPLQPLALTGVFEQDFPTSAAESNAFEWGFALEYSLPYLQQHVKDVGLREPFKNMIPLVEFAMSTGENRDDRGKTTGTINPGVLWEAPLFQIGAEAIVPVNRESGPHVGVTLQMWIFIDDLFPNQFGHPVFGGRQ